MALKFLPLTQIHAEEIKRNKELMEKQKIKERNALNDKLKTAASLRDQNIKRILERLREHVSYIYFHIYSIHSTPSRISGVFTSYENLNVDLESFVFMNSGVCVP